MSSFKRWWKVNGQGIGFITGIVFLNAYFLMLGDLMNEHEWLAGVWLLCFFGFAGWYAWQMRVHGWKLPKNIKDTH